MNRHLAMCEFKLLLNRFAVPLAFVASGSALVAVVWPVLVRGENLTLGGWAGVVAAGNAGILAAFLGPALVVGGMGRDFERGTRQARFLSGVSGLRLALGQLFAVMACVFGTVALSALLGTVGGLADLGLGHWIGRDPTLMGLPHRASAAAATNAMMASISIAWTWLLVLACRSGRRAVLVWMLLTLSLLVPLLRIEGTARELLALHPLAAPWSIVDPFNAEALTLNPTWWSWLSTAVGLTCLTVLGLIGLRRL